MESFITPSNITFLVGMIALLFSVYHYFRNPQIKSEKLDALFEERMENLNKSTDRRFEEINKNFNGLVLQTNNHIHTIDVKVDKLQESSERIGKEIIKLSTIIEERIPKN